MVIGEWKTGFEGHEKKRIENGEIEQKEKKKTLSEKESKE